ncbi:NUDIX hydrolase [Streptomyces sp. SP18BB07]|uniref:NUDIX hydrolase n=1 Tax=Streptomyces sp. SP18BB07 TaxID=3002522 RepID=UPI002E77F04E|nr:NUDIX domain-containing protein [Streptomyces sp. SP18BB07]MEE1764400.1 NUDIX domain-containing protein [Streptomyces sp. SP18BB07]
MPLRTITDVMVILERGGRILLAERKDTGYADGLLNLPSGKVDSEEENVLQAAAREVLEEVGVTVPLAALRIVHVMQYRNPEGEVRTGWFLTATHWEGEPYNAEEEKCAGLSWHQPDRLPDNTVPYNALGISHWIKDEPFSVHGWNEDRNERDV